MKRIIASFAALAAIPVASASAADLLVKAPVPYVPEFSWTGVYAGAEVGGGWASSQSTILTQTAVPPAIPGFPVGFVSAPVNTSGVLGGIYAGGNYQINRFVIGIDGDYTWANLTGSGSDTSPTSGDISYHNDRMSWVSTLTGRVGYAVNNWLLFAKGGAAWAGFGNSSNTTTAAGRLLNTSTASSTRDGWTVGGGFEWAFAPHWSAKLEYDYVRFDTATLTLTEVNATGAVGYPTRSVTSYLDMVKAGVAYRF